ncbi:peroxisomal membrane 22 kDa (Mpv17/PMP22) family protein [Actinidia rufa]|uniref:Endoplasmic reticulum transmembrane protein n=1 Tax=Actinidia rufa TaxID=165716 RepID=A0A7J0D840_9ERIC|nr:peroxisomal membrane 22 kDa (Mpv17/PMP22) family protein [Actinidia rufa]
MGSIVKKGLQQYLLQLQHHPLRTKALSAGFLSAISDIVSQKLTGIQKLQLRRLLLKVVFGVAYLGPFGHFLHILLDKLFKGKKDTKTVAKKVVLEQLTSSPLNNLLFMVYYGWVIEARPWKHVKSKIKKDYPAVQYAAWTPLISPSNSNLVDMIPVLFTLIFAEMALIVIFVFKTPLRKLVIMGLDRLKRGHGPIVVKTVAGTVFVVMISSVYSIMKIQKRWIDDGDLNPTDQVLLSKQLLEASLMGFSLFLALMIDRLYQRTPHSEEEHGGCKETKTKFLRMEKVAVQRKSRRWRKRRLH